MYEKLLPSVITIFDAMKIFQKVKEIRSKLGALHFQRYAIIETSFFAVYIHKIYRPDADKHLHTHPWNFWTIVLSGSYKELTVNGSTVKAEGTVGSGDRSFVHKIEEIVRGPITTLFITWGKSQPWGYLVNGEIVEQSEYRTRKRNGEYETSV